MIHSVHFVFGSLAVLVVGCGDRVLGGTVVEGAIDGGDAAGGSGTVGACASYREGSLVAPGVSVMDYCAAAERICSFSDAAVGRYPYRSLADCQMKYEAQSADARACSAGRVCEAQSRSSPSLCEGVAGCAPL